MKKALIIVVFVVSSWFCIAKDYSEKIYLWEDIPKMETNIRDSVLYYCTTKNLDSEKEKKYEIDFLLVKKKKVCPVEVKSSGYSSHKSFDYFIKKYPNKIEDRYIIYTKDLKFEDGITYIPVYMAGLL